jgi:hypothetical protein
VKRNQEEGKIMLSQWSYIDASLCRYGFEDSKPISMPMDPSRHLTSKDSPKTMADIAHMAKIPYQEAIGTLMYTLLGMRPDITYAVQVLSKFLKNLGEAYWDAVKRVFCWNVT